MMRQRLIIAVATALGALAWLYAAPALRAGDGGGGLSLTTAQGGWSLAAVTTIACGLPALALGVLTAGLIRPVSGLFVVAAALAIVAAKGGTIGDWLLVLSAAGADDALPDAYLWLVPEVVLWQAVLLAAYLLIARLQPSVHRLMRRFSPVAVIDTEPEVTRAINIEALGIVWAVLLVALFGAQSIAGWVLAAAAVGAAFALRQSANKLPAPTSGALAMLTAALVAAWVGYFFIRSKETGQIMWSLVLAFAAGAMVARLIFPGRKPTLIFLSPAVVAVLSYLAMSFQFDHDGHVLRAWFTIGDNGRLPGGLGFALPLQYISAGVVGCCLGLGIARSFTHPAEGREQPEDGGEA